MRGNPIGVPAFRRYQNTVVLLAALVIAAYGLSYAIQAPGFAVLICLVAGAWAILWSIPSLRRTQVVTSFLVHSPTDVVFAFIGDARNLPRWRPEYLSVELTTPEPIGPGSRFREHVRAPNGREVTGQDEYVDFEPNRRFTSRIPDVPSPNFNEVTFEPVEGGTQVTDRFDFEHPFSSAVLGAWFLQAARNRQMVALRRASEVRIKQILET
jgi:ligand-binding SRPBCC domain-containing protein